MVNLSNTNLISSKEKAISFGCEQLGFSREIVNQMFESAKVLEGEKFSTDLFISKIEDVTKPKEVFTSKEFISSISTIFGEVALSGNHINYAEKFLTILNDYDNEKKIDSVGLIDIANEVIKIKDLRNPNDVEKNLALLYDNPTQLFEGLKTILGKNNERWGSTYHITNVYQTIMSELTKEVEDIQLSKKMYSVNNEYHCIILNDMLSGSCSALHKHVSSVKTLVPDIQSLMFDMVLLVGRFVEDHEMALKYVSRQTVNEFMDAGNDVISRTISSVGNSNLLNTKQNKFDINAEPHKHNSVFFHLICSLQDSNLKYSIHNMSLKGTHDMLNFIASCSSEMNLTARYGIRTFVTKGLELTASLEKANRFLKFQTNKDY